jgi:L-methionine (R)-S-oxide reductase
MFETSDRTRNPDYAQLELQLAALLAGERNFVTNAAQFSAFIFQTLADLNWAGFYLAQGEQLLLGPFQGKVACVRIPFGRGVCGTAAVRRETIVVADVHAFDGHIACDSASNSEIVLPVMHGEHLLGVFDIDSPAFNRFSDADRIGLEQLIRCFVTQTDPL